MTTQYNETQVYAVKYRPFNGPATLLLVDAESADDARNTVLGWYREHDMDGVTPRDLRLVVRIGTADEIALLGTVKERQI